MKDNRSYVRLVLTLAVCALLAVICMLTMKYVRKAAGSENDPDSEVSESQSISVVDGISRSVSAVPSLEEGAASNRSVDSGSSSVLEDIRNRDSQNCQNTSGQNDVEAVLQSLSLSQKICQMFFVTPEALTGTSQVIQAGAATENAILSYPVGGLVYFEQNLKDPDQTRDMLSETRTDYQKAGLPAPFLGVDEEGGSVARIADNPAFGVRDVGDMRDVGAAGDPVGAQSAGAYIGAYLKNLGFNLDFAPVADVLTNPDNQVVKRRSFGSDPAAVSQMVRAEAGALQNQGIVPVLKHFPGHGATAADTHKGYASTDKTLDEMLASDLVPFADAVSCAPIIMAAHISAPNATGDETPASLSYVMITEVLRERLGYQGVVITDALNMGAIANEYSSGEAAIRAVQAGDDVLLMPNDFHAAEEALLQAVENGELSEERINESVRRILTVKSKFGLM